MNCDYRNGETPRLVSQPADEVAEAVRLAVSSAQTMRYHHERRRDQRYPFPHPVRLTPIARDGSLMEHSEIVVIAKTVTERGLDFYHLEPVPFRNAIVWLPCGPEKWIGLAIELSWCRFNGYGWYENGGQFNRSAAPLREGWEVASHAACAL